MISAEYRLGLGVSNGVYCANALILALRIESDSITVIEELWDAQIAAHIGRYEAEIAGDYAHKKKELSQAAEAAYHAYKEAGNRWVLEPPSPDAIADCELLAAKFFALAQKKEADGEACIEDYQKAADMYQLLYRTTPTPIAERCLIDLGSRFKIFGDQWTSAVDKASYRVHYGRALQLLNQVPVTTPILDIKCRIYANLGRICFNTQRYDMYIQHIESALRIADDVMLKRLAQLLFSGLSMLHKTGTLDKKAEERAICELLRRYPTLDGENISELLDAPEQVTLTAIEKELSEAAAAETRTMRSKLDDFKPESTAKKSALPDEDDEEEEDSPHLPPMGV